MKLIRFSVCMVVFPIATFYVAFYGLFKGDLEQIAWAGILAVLATNIVIAAYVIMAWQEEEEEGNTTKKNAGQTSDSIDIKKES
jgi:hypothetical protein